MLALAFRAVAALAGHARPPPLAMIPLTRSEIARLLAMAVAPARGTGHRMR